MTFAFLTAMAVSFLGGDDIFDLDGEETTIAKTVASSKIKIPRIESWNYNIHVAKGGRWTFQSEIECSFDGDDTGFLIDLLKGINQEDLILPFQQNTRKDRIERVGKNRWRSIVEADGANVLTLTLMLNQFVGMEPDTFAWNGTSFSSTGRQINHVTMASLEEDSKKSLGRRIVEGVFQVAVAAMLVHIESQFSQDDFVDESGNLRNLPRLTLTTDGKITADAPAEVSADGKMLVIDYVKNKNKSFFAMLELKEWSIRIDDL